MRVNILTNCLLTFFKSTHIFLHVELACFSPHMLCIGTLNPDGSDDIHFFVVNYLGSYCFHFYCLGCFLLRDLDIVDDFVDDAVLVSLFGRQPLVALHVVVNLLNLLTGVTSHNFFE